MIKTPINLQDLRRRLSDKAKAEPAWRFWGLYVHVCKMDTLREAYALAKKNNGAPGIDGVTFEAIEAGDVEAFLGQIRDELLARTYRPLRNRRKEIPKDGGRKVRVLGIPAIRDRVVQGALKLLLLERAKEVTRNGKYTYIEYVRYADDLVILVDAYPRHDWLLRAADKRLREELAKLHVEINEEKSRVVDLGKGESFGFLGFAFRRIRSLRGVWRPEYVPQLKKRTALLEKLRDIFRRFQSQPVGRVVELINPILRGWVNYFAVGHSSRCFGFVRDWVEKKVRRHLMRARGRQGFGWDRWSRRWLYERLGLFNDYRVRRPSPSPKALPAQ
jgi:hypothetical protein